MGAIDPSKMPKGVKKARRDDTDFTQYADGGKVKDKYMKFSETGKPIGMTPVTKAKEGGKVKSKVFVAQPKSIAKKTAGFR